MSRDGIKMIAMLTMLVNHIGYVFFDPPLKELLLDIGYFTAITMCFFLVEGYHYTRSKKKYAVRLFLFALISQLPYSQVLTDAGCFAVKDWNMIANLFLCFLIIHVQYVCPDLQLRAVLTAMLCAFSFFCDWSCMAPFFVLLFLSAGRDRDRQKRAFSVAVLSWGVIDFLTELGELTGSQESGLSEGGMVQGLALSSEWNLTAASLNQALIHGIGAMAGPAAAGICILYLYNGKKSPDFCIGLPFYPVLSKWFFYLFYPAHLLILGLIRLHG